MLHKKVILLTGGADGIGWCCAKAYLAAGARVCIFDKNNLSSEQHTELQAYEYIFFQGDVSKEEDVENVVSEIIRNYGQLDAVHNNAAVTSPSKTLENTSMEEFDLIMNVNVKSIYLTTKYCLEHLKAMKGCILNTSSLVGEIGQNDHAAYVASKGAVNALTKAMALDYSAFGIRVNAILPAAIKTRALEVWRNEQQDPEAISSYLDRLQPLGPAPDGSVIADVATFLLSDAARFVTGCIMPVSGGAELGYRS